MNPDTILRWTCDRCDEVHDEKVDPHEVRNPVLPEGWSFFLQKHTVRSAVRRDVVVTKYLCTDCTIAVRHAAQSAPRFRVVRDGGWDREGFISSFVLPPAYTVIASLDEDPVVEFTRGSAPRVCQCGATVSHSHSGEMAVAILERLDKGGQ